MRTREHLIRVALKKAWPTDFDGLWSQLRWERADFASRGEIETCLAGEWRY